MANANTRQARKTNPKPPATVGNAPNVPANTKAAADWENKPVTFTPLGESEPITLTPGMIKTIIATPSKCGNVPQYRDLAAFMMLCRQRKINPFVKDAYLIGYDERDGDRVTTKWTLIVAIQALRKRAEIHPQYDGCKHGVIVRTGDTVERREGAWLDDGEKLLGGWAEVYRKDRTHPTKSAVKLATYDKKQSRWKDDPEGMISKCAEAAALREAFPSDVGGLYLRDEFDTEGRYVGDQSKVVESVPRQLGDLTQQLAAQAEESERAAAIAAQDQMSVDQTPPEDDGAQAPADASDEPQMSAEELADMERERAQHEGRGPDHGGKAGGLFGNTGPQYQ